MLSLLFAVVRLVAVKIVYPVEALRAQFTLKRTISSHFVRQEVRPHVPMTCEAFLALGALMQLRVAATALLFPFFLAVVVI